MNFVTTAENSGNVTISRHNEVDMDKDRRLSDEDIKALADELECRIVKRFYMNLGRGVWSLAWKVILAAAFLLAGYGAIKGGNPF